MRAKHRSSAFCCDPALGCVGRDGIQRVLKNCSRRGLGHGTPALSQHPGLEGSVLVSLAADGAGGGCFLVLAVLAISTAIGCSALVQSDRVQCEVNVDCMRLGFANSVCVQNLCKASGATDEWSCLDLVQRSTPSGGMVTATLNLVDITTSQAVPNVAGRLCRASDTACENPLLVDLVSDSAGQMTMTAPKGFDGYVELAANGAVTGRFFFQPPLRSDREVPSVPILQSQTLGTFADLAGVAIDPDRGHLLIRSYDCASEPAAGVSYSSAEADSAAAFYVVDGVPSTEQIQTDSSGEGGLLNVRPGSVAFSAQSPDGRSLGNLSVLIRPGEVSYTAIVPTL
jgi:hypothetical protein